MHQRILIHTAREFPSMPDHLVAHIAMVRYNRFQESLNNDPLDGGIYTKRLSGFHVQNGRTVIEFTWVGKNGKTLPEMRKRRVERIWKK